MNENKTNTNDFTERRSCMQCPFAYAQEIMRKLLTSPGQGGPADQIAKMIRENQRDCLCEMLKTVPEEHLAEECKRALACITKIRGAQKKVKAHIAINGGSLSDIKQPVFNYYYVKQVERSTTSLMRFFLPLWMDHNDVFWHALGDYLILFLWSDLDVDYDGKLGTISIRYFDTSVHSIKPPGNVANVIAKIAYLIDSDAISTDFTRFRRMNERRHTIGGMSVEEAALFMTFIKGIGL